jgi:anti-anti-sigma regulatory factor
MCHADTTRIERHFHVSQSWNHVRSDDSKKARARVSIHREPTLLKWPISRAQQSLAVFKGPCSDRRCVLYLEGPLRIPLNGGLRHNVRALLRRGERVIQLDLSRVPKIDAGGVGELVRSYNMATEADGVLQIARPTAWVREVLQRVGLFDVLSQG